MTYEFLTPPERFPAFQSMDTNTAKRHFEWFVGQQQKRIDVLRRQCEVDGVLLSPTATQESLELLGAWARSRVEVIEEPLPKNSLAAQLLVTLGTSPARLSERTLGVVVDVSFYVATYFLAQSSGVQWVLWKKRGNNYNRPVLSGFGKIPLVPAHLVVAAVWGWAHVPESPPDDLTRRVIVWENDIKPA